MFSTSKDSVLRFKIISGIQFGAYKPSSENSISKETNDSLLGYYFLISKFAGINPETAISKLICLLYLSVLLSVSSILNFYFVLFIPLVLVIFILSLYKRIKDRTSKFEEDYPAFLLSLASVVKTGIDPLQALCDTSNIFDEKSLLKKEVIKIKNKLEKGETEQVAINTFADSISHPDLKLFRVAFRLSRQEGSSISNCLQRLTKVTRHRQSFRRRIKSAIAMQKLSSYGIVASACAIALMQYLTNPKAVIDALNHPLGSLVLLFGVSLIVIGIIWMLLVSRIRI